MIQPPQPAELVSADQLRSLCPALPVSKAALHAAALNPAMRIFSIDTPVRIAAFIAQIAHESAGFLHLRELGDAHYLARYEGRRSLGNTEPGDGPRYRGRGYIMITGRANYAKAGVALGLPLLEWPELAEQPEHAATIACFLWDAWRLNALADADRFGLITRKINGGINGYTQRAEYWLKAKRIWT